MRDPSRDVPAAVARAGLWTIVLYAIPILSILLVLPTGQITSLGGFIDAMKAVFTVYGGSVSPDGAVVLTGAGAALGAAAAAGFVLVLFANGLTWLMGATRGLAAACHDGAGPAGLGRFSSRTGTPVRLCLLSGVVATAVAALGFAVSGGSSQKYFAAVLSLSIALIALANLAVFPALVALRHRLPHARRPFAVPGGRPGRGSAASSQPAGSCSRWRPSSGPASEQAAGSRRDSRIGASRTRSSSSSRSP